MIKTNSTLQFVPEELLYGILNNRYDSMILIDNEGTIRFLSDYNRTITDKDAKSYIGSNLNQIETVSKLMETVKKGKPEITLFHLADDRECIVSRVPVFSQGKIVGALGRFMFSSFEQLEKQRNKISLILHERDPYRARPSEYAHPLSDIRYTLSSILGESEAIKEAKTLSMNAASFSAPILITGETGTGKELFANAIHYMSPRKNSAFIETNCAAIPYDLMESEFFGYLPGSFTGASSKGKIGKFERADKGTIFLDEIGDMPLTLQAKVLRVLQEKKVERIGADRPIIVDFRLIAATNKNLPELVQKGLFRKDLYHRINTINIQLPSLSQRADDIPLLLNYFIDKVRKTNNVALKTIDSSVYEILKKYPWPGNVRELQSLAVQLLVQSGSDVINASDLPVKFFSSPQIQQNDCSHSEDDLITLKSAVEKTERRVIIKTLRATGNNKKKAAEILNIQRSQLYEKIKKYNIASSLEGA